MKLTFSLFTLCACFSCFAEQQAVISNTAVEEFGIYMTTVEGTAIAPKTSTGEISLLENPRLLRSTTIIPALRRSSFGIRYKIEGHPEGQAIKVREIVMTPGIIDPDSKAPVRFREENPNMTIVGQLTYMGYRFDQAWEAVPGTWKFEVWHNNQLLLEKEFEVVEMELGL